MAKKLAPFSALQKAKDYIDSKLNTKVDKVSGKGLSTNDYTTTEKNKLSGIASGAEVNVQSDWNQSTTTADDYIKNKPTSMPASDVYAWAKASTKPSYSASEVGLGNVGNFKAVSTVANQGLSYQEKVNAVANIDALPKWCDQYDGYIKQCRGNGVYDYYKIGTINITSAYVNCPLVLELSGRGIPYTTLQIMYDNSSTTDPPLAFFASNNNNWFYIIKTGTSTWDIFGEYSETWGMAALHRVTGTIPGGIQFTIAMENVSSIPSGATQVTYWGNVATAEILRIINQDSSPITSEIILNNINTYSQKGITYHGVNIANYNIMPNISANGFILTIPWAYDGRSGTYFRQFFVDDDHNTPICVRYYSSNSQTFGAWKALAYTDDIPTVNNAILTIQKNGNNVQAFSANQANNVTANIIAAENATLSSQNLNDVVIPGFYNAGGGNTVTNKPSGIDAFGLEVIHSAGGNYYTQIIYSNTSAVPYRRNCYNGTWGSWVLDKLTDTTYSDATTSTSGLMSSSDKTKLAGIASGAEVNVQSDWNQSTTTADDYIKNKPSSMPASDVYAWAKASTKPTYTASEVGLGNVGNFKAVSTVANQGLSDTEKANARDNIGAASDSLATTSVKGLMSPDDKNTLNVLNARHKIRVITAQNSYNSSTGKSTVTFTLNPNNLDGYGKFYRVSSMDSTGFGCMFTFHCFAGGLNISSDKITPNCTMTTSGTPATGLAVTLVSTEGVGYSGQFRVKIETINY